MEPFRSECGGAVALLCSRFTLQRTGARTSLTTEQQLKLSASGFGANQALYATASVTGGPCTRRRHSTPHAEFGGCGVRERRRSRVVPNDRTPRARSPAPEAPQISCIVNTLAFSCAPIVWASHAVCGAGDSA